MQIPSKSSAAHQPVTFSLKTCFFVLIYCCIAFSVWKSSEDKHLAAFLILNNIGAVLGLILGNKSKWGLWYIYFVCFCAINFEFFAFADLFQDGTISFFRAVLPTIFFLIIGLLVIGFLRQENKLSLKERQTEHSTLLRGIVNSWRWCLIYFYRLKGDSIIFAILIIVILMICGIFSWFLVLFSLVLLAPVGLLIAAIRWRDIEPIVKVLQATASSAVLPGLISAILMLMKVEGFETTDGLSLMIMDVLLVIQAFFGLAYGLIVTSIVKLSRGPIDYNLPFAERYNLLNKVACFTGLAWLFILFLCLH